MSDNILGGTLGFWAGKASRCKCRGFWAGAWVPWAGTPGAMRRIELQIPQQKQVSGDNFFQIAYVFKHF